MQSFRYFPDKKNTLCFQIRNKPHFKSLSLSKSSNLFRYVVTGTILQRRSVFGTPLISPHGALPPTKRNPLQTHFRPDSPSDIADLAIVSRSYSID